MKKLFAVVAVAGTLALASCGGGDATTSTVDSTAIKDSIAKAQAAADSANVIRDTLILKDSTKK